MAMTNSGVRVVDPVLSSVALGYSHPDLTGSLLFPRVVAPKRGAKVIRFGKEGFYLHSTRRAPGADTKRIMFGYESDPIALNQDALEAQVPREWLDEARGVPNIDQQTLAVNNVMWSLGLGTEYEQAQLATNPANYGANNKLALAGTSKWSDPASDPGVAVRKGKEEIRRRIGRYPNVGHFSPSAWLAFQNNPKVREQFKYTSPDSITLEMAARYLQLEKVEVGTSVTADQANPAAGFTDVWGNTFVLAYVPQSDRNMGTPSFGYTYELADSPMVEVGYWDNRPKSWIYPVTVERAPYLTSMDAGFLFTGVN